MKLDGLRVCLVGPLPPPLGGMAVLTQQLADLLRSEGASVEVIPVNPPYRPAWIGEVKGLRAVLRLVPYARHLWRATGRADVVHLMANSGWSWHLFAAPAIWIASLRNVPVLVNFHGGEAADFLAKAAASVRRCLGRASALFVPSGFLVDVFARHGIEAHVLPNIVDLSRFSPSQRHRQETLRPHLVVARNLEAVYGCDIAIRAFARIVSVFPEARLTLTGTGPSREQLDELARNLEVADRVSFPGRLDRDQMVRLYQEADLLLNPSRADNMPGAVLEAMASGVPIVASAVGGVPYVLEHGRTALLVPGEQADALAEAALFLLKHPARGEALAQAASLAVRRYDWSAVKPILLRAYEESMRPGLRPALTK